MQIIIEQGSTAKPAKSKRDEKMLFLTSGCTNYYLVSCVFYSSLCADNKPKHFKSLPIRVKYLQG